MANIAEGFERGGTAEFVQFLSLAKASVGEVRSHLYVALDQRYVDVETFERLTELATGSSRLIGGLMIYLKRSGIKGNKFKQVRVLRPTPNTEP